MQWEERWWRPRRTKRREFDSVNGLIGVNGVNGSVLDSATNTNRYDMKDVVAYVLTLCAVALVGSLVAELPLQRALGVQFVVGWFALDLCWSPESKFVRVNSLLDYASFALSTGLSVVAWWVYRDEFAFRVLQGGLAALLAGYWVLTETPRTKGGVLYRGCARALLLYGVATLLGVVVASAANVDFVLHPWYVAFVLNALATTRRQLKWWDRAFHGWTWGVLLEALARDKLVFDKFFYD